MTTALTTDAQAARALTGLFRRAPSPFDEAQVDAEGFTRLHQQSHVFADTFGLVVSRRHLGRGAPLG